MTNPAVCYDKVVNKQFAACSGSLHMMMMNHLTSKALVTTTVWLYTALPCPFPCFHQILALNKQGLQKLVVVVTDLPYSVGLCLSQTKKRQKHMQNMQCKNFVELMDNNIWLAYYSHRCGSFYAKQV